MPEILPLSHLPPASIPALADLHAATMPTLLADLGRDILLRYYQIAQTDPSVIALCALESIQPTPEYRISNIESPITNPQLPIAYCLGSPNPAALNAKLRTPLTWFASQLLKLVFTRPGVLVQLAQSVLTAAPANDLRPGQIELTYIGVAPSARGRGLGKTILSAFVESARDVGYTSVALSVETDNPAALTLYAKFGFTITQTFSEGSYRRHRMELLLG
jgi:ribosomal protein S18 acetylase RimI-like enzyme